MIARLMILVARAWQKGPWQVLPPSCRYQPSCSAYAITAIDRYGAANHHMVGAGKTAGRDDFARERTKAPLHPVTDDGATDLLGDGESHAHRRICILAVADQQHEAGRGGAQAAVGSQEIRALADID